MLHSNMKNSLALQLALDDLIADLRHSRRLGDLGRLALLAYCEVRRWARDADEPELAAFSSEMMTGSPHTSRAAFIDFIDRLIYELLRIQNETQASSSESTNCSADRPCPPGSMHG